MSISADGTLSYNGEKIDLLTIDGKQYFDSNIALALKNLSGDIIDKIQLFQRDIDLSETTSIEDMNKKKNILNIKLKSSKKNKIVGKLSAGKGTEKYYSINSNLNKFSNNSQFSGILSLNNISKLSEESNNSPMGLSTIQNYGLNINNSLSQFLNISFNGIENIQSTQNSTNSQKSIQLSGYRNKIEQTKNSDDLTNSFKTNAKIDYKIDSFISVTQIIKLSKENNTTTTFNSFNNFSGLDSSTILGANKSSYSQSNSILNLSTLLTRKLRKSRGKIDLRLSFDNSDATGTNDYQTSLKYSDGRPIGGQDLNRQNNSRNNFKTIGLVTTSRINLSNNYSLNTIYLLSVLNTTSDNQVFDFDTTHKQYIIPIDSLSIHQLTTNTTNYAGFGVSKSNSTVEFNITFNFFTISQYLRGDKFPSIKRNSTNIYPFSSFTYKINSSNKIRLTSISTITPPSEPQLFSIPDYGNPISLQLSNKNLKNELDTKINLTYERLNPQKPSSFIIMFNYGFIKDKITNSLTIDTLGRQINQFININGSKSFSVNSYYSNSTPNRKFRYTLSATAEKVVNPIIAQNDFGKTGTTNIFGAANIYYNYNKKFEIISGFSVNHTNTVYYFTNQSNNSATFYIFNLNISAELPWGLSINAKYNRSVTNNLQTGFNHPIDLLSAFITKKIIKSKAEIKVYGFNLLDINNNIQRTIGPNFVEDVQSTTMHRFVMASFIFYFK